jgi:hypothetical protein
MKGRAYGCSRLLAMLACIGGLLALSAGSTGWAQVARAQTVPTLTFTPPPTAVGTPRPTAILPTATPLGLPPTAAATTVLASATPGLSTASELAAEGTLPAATPAGLTPAVAGELAACGPALYAGDVPTGGSATRFELGIGTVDLLSADGLNAQGGASVTVARLDVDVVPVAQLPGAPARWRLFSCGLRAAVVGAGGQTSLFITHGLMICLALPQGDAVAAEPRLAYFDSRVGISRWVFMPSQAPARQVCSTPFHLPATFVLLGRAT